MWNFTGNNPLKYSMSMDKHIFLSEESRNEALLVMQISAKDGSNCHIYVGEKDDATLLATMFCKEHNLPDNVIDRVASQIVHRRELAMESRNQHFAADSQKDDTDQIGDSTQPADLINSKQFPNQQLFNRLYGYAALHKQRKDRLGTNIEQHRVNGVLETNFRSIHCLFILVLLILDLQKFNWARFVFTFSFKKSFIDWTNSRQR